MPELHETAVAIFVQNNNIARNNKTIRPFIKKVHSCKTNIKLRQIFTTYVAYVEPLTGPIINWSKSTERWIFLRSFMVRR